MACSLALHSPSSLSQSVLQVGGWAAEGTDTGTCLHLSQGVSFLGKPGLSSHFKNKNSHGFALGHVVNHAGAHTGYVYTELHAPSKHT